MTGSDDCVPIAAEGNRVHPGALEPSADVLKRGHVVVHRSGPVLTVVLDRPQARNAQTPATWAALTAVGESLDPGVRVVVLRGAGASFSAGLDRAMLSPQGIDGEPSLAQLAGMDAAAVDRQIADYQRAFTWWSGPDIVSIAAVQGHAVGAGFQLALACDLRVMADDGRFAMRETSLGLVPDLTGTGRLVEAVGYARALEICVTGRWVGAQEAVDIGLAQVVVPLDQLDAAVDDLSAALTAPDPVAVQETKQLLQSARALPPDQQHARERQAQRRRLVALARAFGTG